jgi:DNA-directed RNA polymerase subunit RPC12/RpoP
METITFNCPACSQSIETPAEMVGQSLVCPTCGQEFTVPFRFPKGSPSERQQTPPSPITAPPKRIKAVPEVAGLAAPAVPHPSSMPVTIPLGRKHHVPVKHELRANTAYRAERALIAISTAVLMVYCGYRALSWVNELPPTADQGALEGIGIYGVISLIPVALAIITLGRLATVVVDIADLSLRKPIRVEAEDDGNVVQKPMHDGFETPTRR